MYITKTCPCNIQRFFAAVKIEKFVEKHRLHFGLYVPPTEGGGHIVFGADPVGVRVRVASFRRDIF